MTDNLIKTSLALMYCVKHGTRMLLIADPNSVLSMLQMTPNY